MNPNPSLYPYECGVAGGDSQALLRAVDGVRLQHRDGEEHQTAGHRLRVQLRACETRLLYAVDRTIVGNRSVKLEERSDCVA